MIDAQDMQSKKALHLTLKEALNLPEYYGNNLDALWDCLMEIPPLELYICHPQALQALPDGYGAKLIALLELAQEERKDIIFSQVREG